MSKFPPIAQRWNFQAGWLLVFLLAGIGSVCAQNDDQLRPVNPRAAGLIEQGPITEIEDPAIIALRMLKGVKHSIVRVFWKKDEGAVHTPGFCVAEGMFLSVRGEAKLHEDVILRTESGTDHRSNVVLVDLASGLVLIRGAKDDQSVLPLKLGGSRNIYIGDQLFGLGLNTEGLAERGIVGALIGRDRSVDGKSLPIAHLRPEIPDGLSDGGLPIINREGEVIGIDLGKTLDDEGEEFHALPAEVAVKLITDLQDFGQRKDAWLGLTFNTGTTTPKVVSVRPGSPGDRANIQPGDVVIQFAGARIDTIDDLADVCYTLSPGREVPVDVLRGVTRVQRSLEPTAASDRPGGGEPGAAP
ncbi:MAG: hypothetical protein ACI8UO_000060 [Verrucomicrobiales bacterium]